MLKNISYQIILRFLAAIILLSAIGYIDFITGYEISVSFFYLIPLAWFAFQKKNHQFLVMATSVYAITAWVLADIYTLHTYSSAYIIYWNATVRFVIFSAVPYLLFSMKIKESELEENHKLLDYQKQELESQRQELSAINNHLILAGEELDRLAIVAREIDNAVVITDKYANILWINEGFKRLHKLTLPELKSRFDNKLSEFYSKQKTSPFIEKCLNEKHTVSFETKYNLPGEKTRYIQTTLTPILNVDNEVVKLIAIDSDISELMEAEIKIREEQEKADELLNNILPVTVASELKSKGFVTPRHYKLATILFTDFTGFTKKCEIMKTHEIVDELNHWFLKFDEIIENYDLEKIKTIGDAYMCAGGIPVENPEHPVNTMLAAFDMLRFMKAYNTLKEQKNIEKWQMRIGIHSGELIGGVIGQKRFMYDVWGDTVNVAARMVQEGEDAKINISEATYLLVRDYFDCTYRGKIEAKNKGKINMYFVDGLKEEYQYLKKFSMDGRPRKSNA